VSTREASECLDSTLVASRCVAWIYEESVEDPFRSLLENPVTIPANV